MNKTDEVYKFRIIDLQFKDWLSGKAELQSTLR